jgi:site-specific recombinase XerD
MLGHASIQSTMRYAHATESDLRDALNTMHKARK